MLLIYIGADYEKVGPKQQCRRRNEIKEHIFGLTSSYSTIGLQVISVQLETSCGNAVNLQLMPAADVRQCETEKDDEIPNVAYLLLKYGVSIEFYHELTMIFDNLPRSYKVATYVGIASYTAKV